MSSHSSFSHSSNVYDAAIIGGSIAGMSAALALGRSLRQVILIDGGKPANRFTPHSHNLIMHDGQEPAHLLAQARQDLQKYDNVSWLHEEVISVEAEDTFLVTTQGGKQLSAKKLVLASGIVDQLPSVPGFQECWGKSIIHCPYCHGYEVRGERTGLLSNGPMAFEMAKMVSQLTNSLTVFTNGASALTAEQEALLSKKGVKVVTEALIRVHHAAGSIESLELENGSIYPLKALYARLPFAHNLPFLEALGIEIAETGYIKVNEFMMTNVPGIYAVGDSSSGFRALSNAIYSGSMSGALINRELVEAAWA